MQIMQHPKFLLFLITIALLSWLVGAISYNQLSSQASKSDKMPQLPQLQVFSPQENATYQSSSLFLNITANNATAKITYSIDGAQNVTLNESSSFTPDVNSGVHTIVIYGFDFKDVVCDSKNVTFTVQVPYPPNTKLTPQQLQETITYFKHRGFILEVYTNDNSSWRTIPVWLNGGVVHFENREALAMFANEHNISELKVYIDSTYVSFNAYVYNNSPLPLIYSFSATIVGTPQQTVEPNPIASTVTIIAKPSILTVISPTNTIYSTNTIEVLYTINSKVLWSYYSIDASEYVDIQHLLHDNGWISFKGNITLNLSEGSHRLKIAVQTEESRGSSVPIAYQTINFTVT
jgi:hypothetical protein